MNVAVVVPGVGSAIILAYFLGAVGLSVGLDMYVEPQTWLKEHLSGGSYVYVAAGCASIWQ